MNRMALTLALLLLFAGGLFGLQPISLAQSDSQTPTATPTPTDTPPPAVPEGQEQITLQISRGVDDVNEDGDSFAAEDSSLWVGSGQSIEHSYLGLHFREVNIPRGSIITSARLEFYVDSDQWIYLSVDISADAAGNSAEFSAANRPSSRPLTSAAVSHLSDIAWPQDSWNVLEDVTPVVQEVVDNAAWASGAAISLIVHSTSEAAFGRKFALSYEADSAFAPRLLITYIPSDDTDTVQPVTPTTTPAITLTPTPTLTPTAISTPTADAPATPSADAQTITVQVGGRQDDVNEDGTGITLNANNIWIGNGASAASSYLGLRFPGVEIPSGATVVEARLELYSPAEQWIALSVTIAADNVDDSPTFTAVDRPSGRVLTSARIVHESNEQWLAESWNVLDDVAGVVQAVIDRPGWSSGNALTLIIQGTGEQLYGRKWATSFNGDPAFAPRLVIVYEPPAS